MRPHVGKQRRRRQQPENHSRVLVERKQLFEDMGSRASWNHPGLNRLEAAVQPGDCVKVLGLDRLGRPRTELLERLDRLRENQVDNSSLREFTDRDNAWPGRCCI